MPNFLEQLVAEWYEYRGYFVRRNVRVGKRPQGGHEGELDVVAFHPGLNRLVHMEPSMDTDSWARRDERFERKFRVGRAHIASLFEGFPLPEPEQFAVLVYGSQDRSEIGGARVLWIGDLMHEIRAGVPPDIRSLIPEQFVILRSLQFARTFWRQTPVRVGESP
jgi:hypothetical protein